MAADLQSVGVSALLVLVVIVAVVVLLGPRIAPALEELSRVSLPAAPAAAPQVWSISTNWGEIDVDVDGALEHATARHGAIAATIMEAIRAGRCQVYLQCGYSWQSLRDGVRGYFSCPLANGEVGIVPFYADGLVKRLVPMTAFPARKGYERFVTKRDGCAPVELLGALWSLVEENDD